MKKQQEMGHGGSLWPKEIVQYGSQQDHLSNDQPDLSELGALLSHLTSTSSDHVLPPVQFVLIRLHQPSSHAVHNFVLISLEIRQGLLGRLLINLPVPDDLHRVEALCIFFCAYHSLYRFFQCYSSGLPNVELWPHGHPPRTPALLASDCRPTPASRRYNRTFSFAKP